MRVTFLVGNQAKEGLTAKGESSLMYELCPDEESRSALSIG